MKIIVTENQFAGMTQTLLYEKRQRELLGEGWQEWAHLAADVVSGAADFVLPGAGIAIDATHAAVYGVESFIKTGKEQIVSMWGAVLTAASALLPAALQLIKTHAMKYLTALVRGSKDAAKLATSGVKKFMDWIVKNIDKILNWMKNGLAKAKNLPLYQKMIKPIEKTLTKAIQFMKELVISYKKSQNTALASKDLAKGDITTAAKDLVSIHK